MGKTWNSYTDAEKAADMVIRMVGQGRRIPDELVASIKATLQTARPGLVQVFYKLLADRPTALEYFTKEEKDHDR